MYEVKDKDHASHGRDFVVLSVGGAVICSVTHMLQARYLASVSKIRLAWLLWRAKQLRSSNLSTTPAHTGRAHVCNASREP